MITLVIVYLIVMVLLIIVPMWKIFTKAGQPGIAAIIPIWNILVMIEIAKKPTWWIILFLVPFVNFIIMIMIMHGISINFGKDSGFTAGLILLPIVFIPILGYGSAQYSPPVETTPNPTS